MKTTKKTAIYSIVLAAIVGSASASVTLNFSAPPFDFSGGFVGSGGENSGLIYGVVIDTAGNGFLQNEYLPGFDVSNGQLLSAGSGVTDDFLWLANGVTNASPDPGGIISNVASIPIGDTGTGVTTAPGQSFALIWFDPNFEKDKPAPAGSYGMLEDSGFTLPPDGTTGGGYNSLPIFDGNPIRKANYTLVPEPSTLLLGLLGFVGLLRRRR